MNGEVCRRSEKKCTKTLRNHRPRSRYSSHIAIQSKKLVAEALIGMQWQFETTALHIRELPRIRDEEGFIRCLRCKALSEEVSEQETCKGFVRSEAQSWLWAW